MSASGITQGPINPGAKLATGYRGEAVCQGQKVSAEVCK